MEINIDALQMLPVDNPQADQPAGLAICIPTCVYTYTDQCGNDPTYSGTCECTVACTDAGCASIYGNCTHVSTCHC
ncbi:ALQxL family class IV lanthipeptide [Streptomyces sp. NPDC005574]|uniref:ALQxL family class IV lanthipeptide n=1 Tax=Streptomyces sp. NPDC005574 TaxID=3156891 RepID=UPI0033B8D307